MTTAFAINPFSTAAGVTDADYLVGTAHAGLSAEIPVGATPGGELGNTWASPTVDAAHAGSAHILTAIKTTDESVLNSTTLQNDDALLVAVAANTRYWFQVWLVYNGGSDIPDLKVTMVGPAGATLLWEHVGGITQGGTLSIAPVAGGVDIAIAADTSTRMQMLVGYISVAGTAGNLQFQFAQQTLDAGSNITVKAGSWLIAGRV
mgnify:FL=1